MTGQGAPVADARRRRATSADVAREAGVSRATVSYVLNEVPNRSIAPATRALVLDVANRLGHVPRASARALRLGSTNLVLALVRDFTFGHIADQMLEGLDVELARRGYVLLVYRYTENVRQLADLWRMVDPAVVVLMGGLAPPDASSAPGLSGKIIATDDVIDHRRSGEIQAEYLASRGHRQLGYAYPVAPGIQHIAQERLRGTRAACARLSLPEPVVIDVDLQDADSARAALGRWRQVSPDVTAVCAHNDELAVVLLLAMYAEGIGKRDPAVMGFDDIPLAQLGITTVAIDVAQFTRRVIERVTASLENRRPRTMRKPVLRLVIRDSA